MHVVLLNQAFHPDVVATAQMAKDLADELARRGHTVTAIASRSIYGQKGAALPARETIAVEGAAQPISARRIGFSLFGKAGTLARVADFGFFYLLATFALFRTKKPDVVVGFSTPPYIALLALFHRFFRGGRAVYWAMDLYPDVMVASGMLRDGSLPMRLLDRLHRRIVRSADATVVLGRCMKARVEARAGASERIRFIPVWSDESGVRPVPRGTNPLRAAWNLGDAFTVMYSGNFGLGHDADTVTGAMAALKDDPSVRFLFVGGGKRRPQIEKFIADNRISTAAYHDYQPRERLAESLSAGDVHIISLREGMQGLIVPSKLFGVLAAGRPAIFIGNPESEIARILTENACGFVVREGDAEGLANAIRRLATDPALAQKMGEAARGAFLGKYDKTTACAAWCDLLESLIGVPKAAAAQSAGAR